MSALLAFGCDETQTSSTTVVTVDDGVLVLEGRVDDAAPYAWQAEIVVATPAAGEYFVLASDTAPTDLGAIPNAACRPDRACDVPGVGTYASSIVAKGGESEIRFVSSPGSATDHPPYFTIVHRDAVTRAPIAGSFQARVTVILDGVEGCGGTEPPPPSVRAAPPLS